MELYPLVRDILTSRVYDVARETPLEPAPLLSARVDNLVLLKREDLQPIFSFKIRGAYNRIVRLSAAERARGVIAASAGNHAQGVALSARRLGIRAVIVMPRTTPEIKINAVEALGAEVVLFGDHYAEAQRHCDELAVETGLTFVHPFDDPVVIAGQGTVAVELLRQRPDLSTVFVPVGGGGLIAGIGAYFKMLRPDVSVIGVQPVDADAMAMAMAAGFPVRLQEVGVFADGVAVQQVGAHTFPIVQQTVGEIVRVTNDEICAAIKDIFDDTRAIAEPAGALAVAGLKVYAERHGLHGQLLAAIISGANMNFDRLRFVAERAEIGEGREALLAVTIPERPGSFRAFCAARGPVVVTEFNYRLSGRAKAEIFVGVSTRSRQDAERLAVALRDAGYETADLSANEIAKLHVRHMVGGRTPHVAAERICRFEFPERPGALLQFLDALGGRWNISLFHYRNHGADFGRVLVGFEVPADQRDAFAVFLSDLGYRYALDENNEAYLRFLG
jgi:threonine dehydratase